MMFSRWPACERPEARSSNPSRRSSPPTMLMLPCSCPVPASMLAGPARLLPSNPRARARAGAGWKMPRRPRARRVAASHQMAGILSQALLALRRQSPQRPPGQPPPSAPAAPVETMLEHCQRAGMAPSPSSIPGSATLSPSKLRQFPALLLGRASHPSVSSLFVVAFDSLIDDGGGDRSLITKRAIGCRGRGARKLEQDLVF